MKIHRPIISLILALNLLSPAARSQEIPALKEAFEPHFLMGAALSGSVLRRPVPEALVLVEKHFSSITAENGMKWERIHPEPGVYNFRTADRLVELGEKNNMFVVGHCLIWHNQTPDWVFHDHAGNMVSRDTLLARMKDHIFTLMGRYRGKVHGYDVVNEAITDRGELRKSLWYQIIGEDYLEHAFRFAHEADPEAQLYYNDFSMASPAKREGSIRMVKKLQAKGIPIHGIGMQGHYDMKYPALKEMEKSILAYAALGVRVMITELDISVLPWPDLPPGAEVTSLFQYRPELDPYKTDFPDKAQQELAKRYADIFAIFVKHSDKISRITFWGVHDGSSWKNNFPIRGRTDFPLLFDRTYQAKAAFYSVLETVKTD
jgi:endo-1,4-beta-xylanase